MPSRLFPWLPIVVLSCGGEPHPAAHPPQSAGVVVLDLPAAPSTDARSAAPDPPALLAKLVVFNPDIILREHPSAADDDGPPAVRELYEIGMRPLLDPERSQTIIDFGFRDRRILYDHLDDLEVRVAISCRGTLVAELSNRELERSDPIPIAPQAIEATRSCFGDSAVASDWTVRSRIAHAGPCVPDLGRPDGDGCVYDDEQPATRLDGSRTTVLFPPLSGPYAMMDQLMVGLAPSR